jgi:hypothetical protein
MRRWPDHPPTPESGRRHENQSPSDSDGQPLPLLPLRRFWEFFIFHSAFFICLQSVFIRVHPWLKKSATTKK